MERVSDSYNTFCDDDEIRDQITQSQYKCGRRQQSAVSWLDGWIPNQQNLETQSNLRRAPVVPTLLSANATSVLGNGRHHRTSLPTTITDTPKYNIAAPSQPSSRYLMVTSYGWKIVIGNHSHRSKHLIISGNPFKKNCSTILVRSISALGCILASICTGTSNFGSTYLEFKAYHFRALLIRSQSRFGEPITTLVVSRGCMLLVSSIISHHGWILTWISFQSFRPFVAF
jgi:hypothetical protein